MLASTDQKLDALAGPQPGLIEKYLLHEDVWQTS
jgi:hypothetical protein